MKLPELESLALATSSEVVGTLLRDTRYGTYFIIFGKDRLNYFKLVCLKNGDFRKVYPQSQFMWECEIVKGEE